MINKLKVLVVDESPLVLPRVKYLLNHLEEDVLIGGAGSPDEAMEIMDIVIPDFVLFDLTKNLKERIKTMTKIRKLFPYLKLIVLANYADQDFKNYCIKLGADYFFQKATEFEKVIEVISQMIPEYNLAVV